MRDKSLAFQYAVKRLRKDRRTGKQNCRHAHSTQPTHLDEFPEFRKEEEKP